MAGLAPVRGSGFALGPRAATVESEVEVALEVDPKVDLDSEVEFDSQVDSEVEHEGLRMRELSRLW